MAKLFDLSHNAPDVAKALAKDPEKILGNLDLALERASIEIADAERVAAPKFRSELTNGIMAGRVPTSPLTHRVVSLRKHGWWVNEGSGPGGVVPFDELIAWIKAKGIKPRKPNMTTEQLANLIGRKIFFKGINKNPFWDRTYEANKDRVVELARAAVARSLGGTA